MVKIYKQLPNEYLLMNFLLFVIIDNFFDLSVKFIDEHFTNKLLMDYYY